MAERGLIIGAGLPDCCRYHCNMAAACQSPGGDFDWYTCPTRARLEDYWHDGKEAEEETRRMERDWDAFSDIVYGEPALPFTDPEGYESEGYNGEI